MAVVPRKLFVVGASGRTGDLLVRQTLEQGHFVTAFARHKNNIEAAHERLSIVEGDVMDRRTLEAVTGYDASSIRWRRRLRESDLPLYPSVPLTLFGR